MGNVFFWEGNKAAVFSIILIKYINSLTLQRVYYCYFNFLEREIKLQSTDRTRWLLIRRSHLRSVFATAKYNFQLLFFFWDQQKGNNNNKTGLVIALNNCHWSNFLRQWQNLVEFVFVYMPASSSLRPSRAHHSNDNNRRTHHRSCCIDCAGLGLEIFVLHWGTAHVCSLHCLPTVLCTCVRWAATCCTVLFIC